MGKTKHATRRKRPRFPCPEPWPETIYECPGCGFQADDSDDFDVAGADGGKLFCPECGGEFEMLDRVLWQLEGGGRLSQRGLFG